MGTSQLWWLVGALCGCAATDGQRQESSNFQSSTPTTITTTTLSTGATGSTGTMSDLCSTQLSVEELDAAGLVWPDYRELLRLCLRSTGELQGRWYSLERDSLGGTCMVGREISASQVLIPPQVEGLPPLFEQGFWVEWQTFPSPEPEPYTEECADLLASEIASPPRATAFGLSLGSGPRAKLWSIHGDLDYEYIHDWYGLGGIVGYQFGFIGEMTELPNGDWLIEANELTAY